MVGAHHYIRRGTGLWPFWQDSQEQEEGHAADSSWHGALGLTRHGNSSTGLLHGRLLEFDSHLHAQSTSQSVQCLDGSTS